MTPAFVMELACEPVGKARPRFVRATGHTYTPEKTRKYEDMLRQEAAIVMGPRAPLDGPLDVLIHAVMPIPASWSKRKRAEAALRLLHPTGKPDADNLLKACADALNKVVWSDDAQIVKATVLKEYGESPRIIIRARSIAAGDAA